VQAEEHHPRSVGASVAQELEHSQDGIDRCLVGGGAE
jgi:hypothetical protein